MRLSISAQFTLLHRPPDYRGPTSARISFGKGKPASLSTLLCAVVKEIIEWHMFMDTDEMNAELDKARPWLCQLRIIEEVTPEAAALGEPTEDER